MSESSDLAWLAFRYVAGELTADDEHRFERRLADDQTAREAVEEAVALHEAIRLTAGDISVQRSPRTSLVPRRMAWTAASVACMVLAVSAIWLASQGSRFWASSERDAVTIEPDRQIATPAASSDSVALAWANLHNSGLNDEEVLAALPSPEAAIESGAEEAGVPRWMMTAFSDNRNEREENR